MKTTATFDPNTELEPAGWQTVHHSIGDSRRQALVQAAFDLIAERGLEGLRTREIAARAGMNIAMVHYYFAGKQSLIGGVVDYLADQFTRTQAAPVAEGQLSALQKLQQEFKDSRLYTEKYPTLVIVYAELFLRSRRDPSILPMLKYLEKYWFGDIESLLQEGLREGVFRSDLDVVLATNMIMSLLRGSFMITIHPFDFDRAYQEVERWLTS
ncbi:MAG: TetR/AcrR family transcriptional regulator [Anaerolineaceae bacterium]|nr:TetR/AcrR family transcriptional regulator [Anaerolineaceae bacterium]